jgi:uncharacterized protein
MCHSKIYPIILASLLCICWPIAGYADPLEDGLLAAANSGDMGTVVMLLERGAAINARNDEGATPLMLASSAGNIAIMKLLLLKGAEVNAASDEGITALTKAVFGGHRDAVLLLLHANADIDAATHGGINAIQAAEKAGNPDVLSILKQAKSAPIAFRGRSGGQKRPIETGFAPLIDSCLQGRIAQVSALLEGKAPLNAVDKTTSMTPLMAASVVGEARIVRMLLKQGADVRSQGPEGTNALILSAACGHLDVVRLLIASGADVNVCSLKEKVTPLMLAALKGHTDIVSVLLENGADVRARDKDGETVLIKAAIGRDAHLVGLLLDAGASVNDQATHTGVTALMVAAAACRLEVAKTLLQRNADPNIRAKTGVTAPMVAMTKGCKVIRDLFMSQGGN